MAEVVSASGYLALLSEPEQALQVHALEMLNQVVHKFWFEIAECVSEVEAHYENEKFQNQPLAALVASKVRISPCAAWRLFRLSLLPASAGCLQLMAYLSPPHCTGVLQPWRAR